MVKEKVMPKLDEIKVLDQWVNVSLIDRGGDKKDKVPYTPLGLAWAKANDRKTWGTYKQACNNLNKEINLPYFMRKNPETGKYTSKKRMMKFENVLGFYFSMDDVYIGLDFDNCVKDGRIENIIFNSLIECECKSSYTEISMSGTGVKQLLKLKSLEEKKKLQEHILKNYGGKGTGVKNNSVGMEFYFTGRYFALTGNMIYNYDTIEEITVNEVINIIETYIKPEKKKSEKHTHSSSFSSEKSSSYDDNKDWIDDVLKSKSLKRSPSLNNKQILLKLRNQKYKEDFINIYDNGENIKNDWSSTDMRIMSMICYYTQKQDQVLEFYSKSKHHENRTQHENKSDREDYIKRTFKRAIETLTKTYEGKKQGQDNNFYYENEDGRQVLDQTKLRDHLRDIHNIFNTELGFYTYSNGLYELTNRNNIAKLIELHVEKKDHKESVINEVINRLGREFKSIATFEVYTNIINLNNNYLEFNFKNGEYGIKDHTPNKIFTQKFDLSYDKNIKCNVWQKFLNDVLPQSQQYLLQEILGYMLIADNRAKRIYGLLGKGDCGKSVILTTLNNIIGQKFVSNLSWQKIAKADNKFAAYQLYNKLVNITGDLPQKSLEDTGLLKDLSGGDYIDAEPKGKNNFSYKNTCRLLASMNKMIPAPTDKTSAWYNRLLIIPFEIAIPEEKQDKHLIDKFNLTGVFNWCVEGLQRLLKNNLIYTETEENKSIIRQYKIDNDSVLKFIDECCSLRGNIIGKDLYTYYCNYCNTTGLIAYKLSNFTDNLLLNNNIRKDKNCGESKTGSSQGHKRGFKGISLNPESDYYEEIKKYV
jgi:P4 family phage/plasmid primase-like protien